MAGADPFLDERAAALAGLLALELGGGRRGPLGANTYRYGGDSDRAARGESLPIR